MANIKRIENLEQYFINAEIMNLTALQAAKDLNIEPFQLSFNSNDPSPHQQMQAHVLPRISELLNGNSQKFQQTIYQIDLSENLFRRSLQSENPAVTLTDEILKRLLQKVVLRKLYSAKNT